LLLGEGDDAAVKLLLRVAVSMGIGGISCRGTSMVLELEYLFEMVNL